MTREQQLEAENKRLKEQRIRELEAENAKLKRQQTASRPQTQSRGSGIVDTAVGVGLGVLGANAVMGLFDDDEGGDCDDGGDDMDFDF